MWLSHHWAKYLLRGERTVWDLSQHNDCHQNEELLEMPSILFKFDEFYYFRIFCFFKDSCYYSYSVVQQKCKSSLPLTFWHVREGRQTACTSFMLTARAILSYFTTIQKGQHDISKLKSKFSVFGHLIKTLLFNNPTIFWSYK